VAPRSVYDPKEGMKHTYLQISRNMSAGIGIGLPLLNRTL